MNNGITFQSRDFYLSACLRAAGATLTHLEPIDSKTYLFHFDISPLQANNLIEQHWNGKLVLPTKAVIDAINELKTRLHQGL